MNKVSLNVWKLALLLLAASMLLWACSTKPTNDPPVNQKPVVEIVNIPPTNSHFTQSPVINWYGTDSDGFIVQYEYAVVPFTDIPSSVDTTSVEALAQFAQDEIKYVGDGDCYPACWTVIDARNSDSPTRQRVELVAGANPADTVKQYFFVRAVDDDSARSDIRVRVYSRNNNPPNTVIKTTPDAAGYYDLSEKTATYIGIMFEWTGEDKIDFPSEADKPTFEYFYQLFGPYNAGELPYDSTGEFVEGYAFDTLDAVASHLVTQSIDSTTGEVWVSNTDAYFYDLWRNAGDVDTSRVGDFVLKVTARDDAAVSDVSPAYKVFRAINPQFENDVLVYYPVNGAQTAQPGSIWSSYWRENIVEFPDTFYVEDDMLTYFYQIFEEAGYPIPTIIRDIPTENIPSKETLGKYKIYVMLEDGQLNHLTKDHFLRVSKYLDFGGSVLLWGTQPFGAYQPNPDPGLQAFQQAGKDPVETIPYRYFDVVGQYRGGWAKSYSDALFWLPSSGEPLPQHNDDFIGAEPLPSNGFPYLSVDFRKVQGTYIYLFKEKFPEKPWMNIVFRGSPNASYFLRGVFSEPLYLYKSYFGEAIPDSMKTWITPLQGRVDGLRFDSGTYRTAVFGFSLWTLQHDSAVEALRKILDWLAVPHASL